MNRKREIQKMNRKREIQKIKRKREREKQKERWIERNVKRGKTDRRTEITKVINEQKELNR